jgi:hypothetical protein
VIRILIPALATGILAAECFGDGGNDASERTFATRKVDGLTLPARVEGRAVAAAGKDGFIPLFWAGVNLGSTVPGRQPGEVAATRADYDR